MQALKKIFGDLIEESPADSPGDNDDQVTYEFREEAVHDHMK